MNNSRNRDVLTRAKASRQLVDYEELIEHPIGNNYEDKLIEEMDKKDIRDSIDWLANELGKDEETLEAKIISETKQIQPSKRK